MFPEPDLTLSKWKLSFCCSFKYNKTQYADN